MLEFGVFVWVFCSLLFIVSLAFFVGLWVWLFLGLGFVFGHLIFVLRGVGFSLGVVEFASGCWAEVVCWFVVSVC